MLASLVVDDEKALPGVSEELLVSETRCLGDVVCSSENKMAVVEVVEQVANHEGSLIFLF